MQLKITKYTKHVCFGTAFYKRILVQPIILKLLVLLKINTDGWSV